MCRFGPYENKRDAAIFYNATHDPKAVGSMASSESAGCSPLESGWQEVDFACRT